jgi:phenylpyruvate tautomerase
MPLCRILTSANASEKTRSTLLTELSRFVAEALKKPESYVMTSITSDAAMTFAGTSDPACFVELKSIGTFSPQQTAALSAELCQRIGSALAVPASRIYIEFGDSKGYLWGHDGETLR